MTAILGLVFGGFNLYGISQVLRGGQFLTYRDEKSAFVSAFIVALFMCGMGIATTMANSQLKIPGFVSGALLGIVNLLLLFFVLSGRDIPVLGSVRNGLIVLLSVIAVKMTLTMGIWVQGSLRGNL